MPSSRKPGAPPKRRNWRLWIAMACSYVIQRGSVGPLMVTLRLFCERRERVFVLFHNLIGYFHGLLEVGIVRHCLKSAASEFGNMQFLTPLEIEPLHQFA